ncbi:MAG: hypothetical protein HY919_01055 [Elusimicrobia bacterium]|nr:hypothetical protein [Elusimicrobiota bacterium]
MKVTYLTSFLKLFDELTKERQAEVSNIVSDLINLFVKRETPVKGLGLKKLRKNFWEVRLGLKRMILFKLEAAHLIFIILGNHEDIRRFLRK